MKKSTTPKEQSPASKRELMIAELPHDELISLAIFKSRKLQEARALLKSAAKLFRWMQKPTEAHDIDKFLDSIKEKE